MVKEAVKIDLGIAKRVKHSLFCVVVPFDLVGKKYIKIGAWGGLDVSFNWGIMAKDANYVFAVQEVTNCSPKNIDEKMISLMKKLYKYSKSKRVSSDIEDGIKRAFRIDTNVRVVGSLPKKKIHSIINTLIKYKLEQLRKGYLF